MPSRALVVIGASAGGLAALEALVRGLPADLPAALCVVLHIGNRPSTAPAILAKAGPLPAAHAVDGEALRPGVIHVAPPDRHLLVTPTDRLRLSRGPRENGTRPAVDPLFRSAASVFGPRAVGVVLSGALDDGTAGLDAIKRAGGVTVVQAPADARHPGMPRNALDHVAIDHCAPAVAMGPLIARLVADIAGGDGGGSTPAAPKEEARMEEAGMEGDYTLKRPVAMTCPTCGGAVAETGAESPPCFVCHIGHRFGGQSMEEAQFRALEQALEVALRALNERAELCRRLAAAAHRRSHPLSAVQWEAAVREAEERAKLLMGVLRKDWLRPAAGNGNDPPA